MGRHKKTDLCPFGGDGLSGKWKYWIIYHLASGTKRFAELQRLVPDVSRQMLTLQLRELAAIGIVERQAHDLASPRVDYFLTPAGWLLVPLINQMRLWGEALGSDQDVRDDWMLSFSGRWTFWIWYFLTSGPKCFGDLQRALPDASRQMLSLQLRKLQQAGVLERRVTCARPSRPIYALTEQGQQSAPLLRQMVSWGTWLCDELGLEYVYPLNNMIDVASTL